MCARVALVAERIAGHSLVAEFRVAELDGQPAAAVVPNARGVALLRARGWLGYVEALVSPPLADEVAWRFVESLAQCHTDSDVAALLRAPLTRVPQLVEHQRPSADTLLLRYYVPLDLAICREHFPRAPIVPGVVQLTWAETWAREYLDIRGRFVALEAVKFQRIVQPGDVLDLRLDWQATTGRLCVLQTSPAGRHASGRLVYELA
jgi:3-hydroxymyristoyl/3-hydroxydecanoyl-(acyl carrier protein) dehydratase